MLVCFITSNECWCVCEFVFVLENMCSLSSDVDFCIIFLSIESCKWYFQFFPVHRVLQNQLITMSYGTIVIWVQIKFKNWHTTCVTPILDVKEVSVILHLRITHICRLLEQGSTTMLWSQTQKINSLVK